MVHKRKDRPNEGYRVWLTLPQPWGEVGPWQTGLHRKRQAEDVQSWLRETAVTRPEVIDLLVSGRFNLRDVWVAKLRGTLDALLLGLSDPLLKDAVEEYRKECKDGRALSGLDQLLEYADPGVRLSWLRGNNIRRVYRQALDAGRKPNSVRRSLYRAICELLSYHLTEKGRLAAMEGVNAPHEDDTRVVHVTPEEIKKVLEACVPESFRWLVVTAIATAIDRGPLLKLTPRHINSAEGLVSVQQDRKTSERPRMLRVSSPALVALRLAAMGKEPHERLWALTPGQVNHAWRSAREAAGMKALRFKDLRHLLPTLLAEMGMDRRSIQAYLGHAMGSKQTDRYITPSGDVALLDAAVERLGLSGVNLRAG